MSPRNVSSRNVSAKIASICVTARQLLFIFPWVRLTCSRRRTILSLARFVSVILEARQQNGVHAFCTKDKTMKLLYRRHPQRGEVRNSSEAFSPRIFFSLSSPRDRALRSLMVLP